MSAFSRMDAVAAQAMVAVHADPWTLAPKVRGADVNAAAIVDASRPACVVLGIFREKEAPRSIPNAYDRRTDQRPGIETAIPTLEVDRRVQAAGFIDVRAPDLVTDPAGKVWRVTKISTDDMGRIHASLNLVS